jgi:hypothetical protein
MILVIIARFLKRVSRKLALLKQVRESGPLDSPMLAAKQGKINNKLCLDTRNSMHFRGEKRGFG